jgi:transposase InsO family protein
VAPLYSRPTRTHLTRKRESTGLTKIRCPYAALFVSGAGDGARTGGRSPQTNGVIERLFGALKFEHLYREKVEDGPTVAAAASYYRTLYHTVRPREAIAFRTPLTAWRHFDSIPASNKFTPGTVSLSTGHPADVAARRNSYSGPE